MVHRADRVSFCRTARRGGAGPFPIPSGRPIGAVRAEQLEQRIAPTVNLTNIMAGIMPDSGATSRSKWVAHERDNWLEGLATDSSSVAKEVQRTTTSYVWQGGALFAATC